MFYKSKNTFLSAQKKQTICKSCSAKKQYADDPLKNKGSSNGRFGKSIKEISIDKYGKEIGMQKYEEWSQKLEKNGFQEGKLNPSFGKSPPTNAGRSYKGWYKDLFFRSTLELAFILKYESLNKCLPISGDDAQYRLTYKSADSKIRTYVPDFVCLINNIIYELKASAFVSDKNNLSKTEAAHKLLLETKFTYKVITEKDIDNFNCDSFLSKLKNLHDTGKIKLTDKSVIKLNKRLKIS
jgi:hypothetical protein